MRIRRNLCSTAPAGLLSLNLGLSNRFCVEDVTNLWSGFVAAAKEHSIKHLSLEINLRSRTMYKRFHRRQKKGIMAKVPAPKNMDLICLTGNVGAAYMGLHAPAGKVSFIKESSQQPDLSKLQISWPHISALKSILP